MEYQIKIRNAFIRSILIQIKEFTKYQFHMDSINKLPHSNIHPQKSNFVKKIPIT